jgi:hydroxyethylthiazole kinase-like sugar kinase family protein
MPTDIVAKVLNDNLGEITYLAGEIMKMYGVDIDEVIEQTIKN